MQGASMLAASPHGAADVGDAAIGSSRPGRALAPRGLSCSEGRSEGQSGYESTVSLPYWAPQGRSRAQSKDRGYKLPFDNYAQPRRAHVPVEGFADSKVRGSGWAGPPSVSAESNLTTRSPPQPSSSSPDLHAPADPPQWRHRGGAQPQTGSGAAGMQSGGPTAATGRAAHSPGLATAQEGKESLSPPGTQGNRDTGKYDFRFDDGDSASSLSFYHRKVQSDGDADTQTDGDAGEGAHTRSVHTRLYSYGRPEPGRMEYSYNSGTHGANEEPSTPPTLSQRSSVASKAES